MLLNTNGYPIVAQTWVDNGDVNAAPELSHAPFVTLPSVFALPPSALKGLRILFAGANLPTDRESVFWLNLYEIPPSQPITPPLASRVTLAMNTQMKIFYRPKALPGNAENAAEAVSFTLQKRRAAICCAVTTGRRFISLRPHRRENRQARLPGAARKRHDDRTVQHAGLSPRRRYGADTPFTDHRSGHPHQRPGPADRQVIHSKPITIKAAHF